MVLSVQLINIRSSISAQQTWINIHLSLGGQNNSHPAALLSTNRRARSEGRLPSRWPSAGINDISGYTLLTNDSQLANFNNHFIYGSTWTCITWMLVGLNTSGAFPFLKDTSTLPGPGATWTQTGVMPDSARAHAPTPLWHMTLE